MSKLAARLALSVAAASVAVTGLEALRLRHPRAPLPTAPAVAATETTVPPPRLEPRVLALTQTPPSRRPRPLGGVAMARIRGRVVGEPAALDDLEVEIEDGQKTYQSRLADGGRFEINLPPGSYGVIAHAGEQVAFAQAADVVEGEARELVLVLGEGVSISGRVDGCDGPCYDTTVEVAGLTENDGGREDVTNRAGELRIDDLVPGRAYDLTLSRHGKRTLTMRGITAPRQGLVAILEDTPTLTGGFGVAQGEECPMEDVSVSVAGSEDTSDEGFDQDCRFHFDELPDGPLVHLTANGEGWHFELDVLIPEHGDPPFLCLRAPCPAPQPQAKLAVQMGGRARPSGSR